MIKFYLIYIFFLITATLFGNNFYTQDSVGQGEIITFVISPVDENIDYTFTILNRNGSKILTIKGFNYYFYENMTSMILGLGGIPSNLAPGEYKIKATGRGLYNSYFFERPLVVTDSNFRVTKLEANSKMDSIINGVIDDKRKDESQRLWDSISTFSPFILHEDGRLQQPVEGRYTSPFGSSRVTNFPNGKESVTVHNGEDIATDIGTEVKSDGRGVVLLAENRVVTGNTIVVEHLPGVVSIYYHMDSFSVARGDFIEQGDIIGRVGTTGYSTGPHLHWEVRVSTVPVNPMGLLRRPLIDKSLIMNMLITTNNKKGG